MNIGARLERLEKQLNSGRDIIPSAVIRHSDGTETTVNGYFEAYNAALAGDVESITGDEPLLSLCRALTGTL